MRIIRKSEYEADKHAILSLIKEGVVFIYPTDTIYGIGCDATDPEAVSKLREIKQRYDKPFSVIAPSKKWIKEKCVISSAAQEWLEKLPGPYTLVLPLKDAQAVSSEVHPLSQATLGVRMPDHWAGEIAKLLNTPIVTTSANVAGKEFMTSLENLDEEIEHKIDFILYEGEKKAKPSQLVDLSNGEVEMKER